MDEERSNGILRVLFKVIIVIIFILFIIWLLSVSIRNNTNNVVTDEKVIDSIYQQNLDRIKDAGISYYTLERLPKNTNDMRKITLGEMYDAHLLLEVKDEDGNACSTDNSYVEVVKLENEYRMKVKLQCPKKDSYIVVYLGCYDYCKGFICEKEGEETKDVVIIDEGSKSAEGGKNNSSKPKPSTGGNSPKPSSSSQNNIVTEYEYVKRTNGYWTDWSSWSKWQRDAVIESDTVRVQTKVVTEDYTYEEEIEQFSYDDVIVKCPSGYEPNPNGNNCRKITNQVTDPVCPIVSGYTLIGQDGFTCTYKSNKSYDKVCPTVSGYTLINNDGTTCTYKSNKSYDPVCPTVSGYTLINSDGTTCTYKSNKSYDKVCPTVSGYTLINNDGTTCTYKSNKSYDKVCPTVSGYTLINNDGTTCTYKSNKTEAKVCPDAPSGYTYTGIEDGKCVYTKKLRRDQGTEIPKNTSTRIYIRVAGPMELQDCDTCGTYWGYIYDVYARKALSKVCPNGYELIDGACHKKTTKPATCPEGTENISGTCRKKITRTLVCPEGTENLNGICVKKITRTATCPEGTENLNGICVKKKTRTAICPEGTEELNGICVKKITKTATCPTGYIKKNNTCKKVVYKDYVKSCPTGYNLTDDETQCYKREIVTVLKHGTREVTLYRFATREYIGGSVVYKWSTSNHDESLLSQGYVLTGRTRQRG